MAEDIRVSIDNPLLDNLMDAMKQAHERTGRWPHVVADHVRRELVITPPDEEAEFDWRMII